MVTVTELAQLKNECENWRENLRHYRQDLNNLKTSLYEKAAGKTDHDFLKEVEHYHNQFHIQQINIHDLKHTIKHHIAEAEHHPNFGHRIPHHNIELQYKNLITDLDKLMSDYNNFISS
jgi:hypothetical protein